MIKYESENAIVEVHFAIIKMLLIVLVNGRMKIVHKKVILNYKTKEERNESIEEEVRV